MKWVNIWKGVTLLVMMGALILVSWYGRGEAGAKEKTIRIGVAVYQKNDIFISGIKECLEQIADGRNVGKKRIQLDIADGESNQALQNEQVEKFVNMDYDVICVNLVERTNAAVLVEMAESAGIPLIFFNREPVKEDIMGGSHIYYVGSDARASARMQAELVARAYKEDSESIDKNGDGIIQYAMLEGQLGHQDTVIRTEYSVEVLENAGIPLEKTAGGSAGFERTQAAALTDRWIGNGTQIELILSNNDDMTLGALDALEKHGKLGEIVVVGIDGTKGGKEAVDQQKLLGTVVSDSRLYAKTLFEAACFLAEGEELASEMELIDERYLWIPWELYTQKK